MAKDKAKTVPDSVYRADEERAELKRILISERRAMKVLGKGPGPAIEKVARNFLDADDFDDSAIYMPLSKIVEKLDKFAEKAIADEDGAPISLLERICDAGLLLRAGNEFLMETLETLDRAGAENVSASVKDMIVGAFLIGKYATLETAQYDKERLRKSALAGSRSGEERKRSANERWGNQALSLAKSCLDQRGRRYPSQEEIADFIEAQWSESVTGEGQKPRRSSIKRMISIWKKGGKIISKADWKNRE